MFLTYGEIKRFLDHAGWNRTRTVMALTMISCFFVWGMLFVMATLVTQWSFISTSEYIYILVSSPAVLLA